MKKSIETSSSTAIPNLNPAEVAQRFVEATGISVDTKQIEALLKVVQRDDGSVDLKQLSELDEDGFRRLLGVDSEQRGKYMEAVYLGAAIGFAILYAMA